MDSKSLSDQILDEVDKLMRRIRILVDAGEHKLAFELYEEAGKLAVKASVLYDEANELIAKMRIITNRVEA